MNRSSSSPTIEQTRMISRDSDPPPTILSASFVRMSTLNKQQLFNTLQGNMLIIQGQPKKQNKTLLRANTDRVRSTDFDKEVVEIP